MLGRVNGDLAERKWRSDDSTNHFQSMWPSRRVADVEHDDVLGIGCDVCYVTFRTPMYTMRVAVSEMHRFTHNSYGGLHFS